jgi:hypothetical protein
MSFTSEQATERFNLTAEQNAHVHELNSVEEITAYMKECAIENGVAEKLAINGSLVEGALVEPKAQPTVTIKIGGITLSGSQEEVNAQLSDYYKTHPSQGNQPTPRPTNNQPARDEATGRFAKTPADQGAADENGALKAAAAAELELKFKRGEVSTAQYIRESGVLDSYLAEKGIDVNAHQAQVQEGKKYEQSWAQATTAWKQTEDGRQSPGGETFTKAMGEKLIELGLEDKPSAESVQRAYNALAIEAEMSTCTDKYQMNILRERYRKEAQGIFNSRGTATF